MLKSLFLTDYSLYSFADQPKTTDMHVN